MGNSDFITASLLNDVMAKVCSGRGDGLCTYEVLDWQVAPAVGKGENFTSQLQRVKVKVMALDTMTFVVKCPLQGPLGRHVQEAGIWDKEVAVYSCTLPALHDLLGGEACITPRLLALGSGGQIVLEDIRPRGYRTVARREQLDFDHCLVAIESVAKLHAASVVAMETDVGDIPYTGKELVYCDRSAELMTQHLTPVFTCLADEVETWPGFEQYAAKIRSVGAKIFPLLKKAAEPSQHFNVLNHGDLWANNIMFKYDKCGRPIKAKLVDFQVSRWTSPAHDLNYLIVSSMDENTRKSRLDNLLEFYIETLNNHLVIMGSKKQLTLQSLKEDLQRTAIYGLYVAASTVATKMSDETIDFDSSCDEKHSNPYAQAMKSRRYREIMPNLLAYFDEQGVFDSAFCSI